MKELILIPCSGTKHPGGRSFIQGRKITDQFTETNTELLQRLRQHVAESFGIDLPKGKNPEDGPLKSAFERYSGNLYSQIPIYAWAKLKEKKDMDLVIISALYGMVYWDEPIIDYNVCQSLARSQQTADNPKSY